MNPMGYSMLRITASTQTPLLESLSSNLTWKYTEITSHKDVLSLMNGFFLAQLMVWLSLGLTLQEGWDHCTYESTRYNITERTYPGFVYGFCDVCQSNVHHDDRESYVAPAGATWCEPCQSQAESSKASAGGSLKVRRALKQFHDWPIDL